MGVVWNLLRRVELKAAVRVPMGDDGVGFREAVMHTQHGPRAVRGGMR